MLGAGGGLTGPRLLGPAEVRLLASRLDVRPTKRRGQNFVIDPNTVRRIVTLAGIRPGDTVLEVGPGLGSLTLGLLGTGAPVTAVEIDAALAGGLRAIAAEYAPDAGDLLTVVHDDALHVRLDTAPTVLVANLPYNVAVPVLLRLWQDQPSLRRALVMVQREVAERLAAAPGSRVYGVPSVKAAWFARVHLAGPVARQVFWPTPNVDSALVEMDRRDPPTAAVGRARVFDVVDAAFAQRRKMLRSSLSALAPAGRADEALVGAGIDPTERPERLTVSDFARLADALSTAT
ncbi:MAG: 16S rRNA (adenine(1518)-N(6)/adenine(1519)-N(6))-dimethyltransferase RsmA [Nocardioidaceae bacterium]